MSALEAHLTPDVERAQSGDVEAFSRLVERTSSMVCGVAFAVVRDVPTSEDIAQEVFLSVWRGLGKLQNPRSFLPWLRQMTRNKANSSVRKIYSRRVHDHAGEEALAQIADPGLPADVSLEDRQNLELVAKALEEIPDESREVLVLYYREGRSSAQVADLLGLSEAAVRKRLSRARQQMKDEVTSRIRSGLERSAPGLALVTAVVASVSTTAAPASAVVIGGAGLRSAAAGGAKLGGLAGLLAALPGVLGGIGGIVFGLRGEFARAIDDREIRELERFRMVGVAVVVLAGLGLVWSTGADHWLAPTAVYLAFMASLRVLYFHWLPRIRSRRIAHELATDPSAPARHEQDLRVAFWGYSIGAVLGGLGLLAGLLTSGLLRF